MSWTNQCTEGTYCKYKNTQEVREVLEQMGFVVYTEDGNLSFFGDSQTFFDESTEVVLSLEPIEKDGEKTNLVGISSDCVCEPVDLDTLEEEYGLKEGQYMVTPIVEYLQDQLVDEKDNILVVTCAGFEERCSGAYAPFGDITVISKYDTDFKCLQTEQDNLIAKFNEKYEKTPQE